MELHININKTNKQTKQQKYFLSHTHTHRKREREREREREINISKHSALQDGNIACCCILTPKISVTHIEGRSQQQAPFTLKSPATVTTTCSHTQLCQICLWGVTLVVVNCDISIVDLPSTFPVLWVVTSMLTLASSSLSGTRVVLFLTSILHLLDTMCVSDHDWENISNNASSVLKHNNKAKVCSAWLCLMFWRACVLRGFVTGFIFCKSDVRTDLMAVAVTDARCDGQSMDKSRSRCTDVTLRGLIDDRTHIIPSEHPFIWSSWLTPSFGAPPPPSPFPTHYNYMRLLFWPS